MNVSCSTLEQLFLTVPKTEWPRLWRRVNVAQDGKKKDLLFRNFISERTCEPEVFNWDDAPSEEEDLAGEDILNIKEIQPAVLALVDAQSEAEKKESDFIDVELPFLDQGAQNAWMKFVSDTLYVCSGSDASSGVVVLVAEHLLRWFSFMAAAPQMWEEEYPLAMKQSNAAVDEREALETLRKKYRRKQLNPDENIAEKIFSPDRFTLRLQKFAERTRNLSDAEYQKFVARRNGLSKVKVLIRAIFHLSLKLQQVASFLLNDRVRLIDENPLSYVETIAAFDANDEAMARRHNMRRPVYVSKHSRANEVTLPSDALVASPATPSVEPTLPSGAMPSTGVENANTGKEAEAKSGGVERKRVKRKMLTLNPWNGKRPTPSKDSSVHAEFVERLMAQAGGQSLAAKDEADVTAFELFVYQEVSQKWGRDKTDHRRLVNKDWNAEWNALPSDMRDRHITSARVLNGLCKEWI
eukprot:GEMP01041800.1.p1 GENE.GEMP01041800.1~~GEMP01041800.1.p1  ORF type:complete len:468 (+),score=99.54 GEMP01041800.1:118-1521(+)